MPAAGLAARGVTRAYGGLTAVDAVDLDAPPGRVTALLGPNGAGKTTLFRCLSGVERPDAGRLALDGRDVTALTQDARARLGLALTFQQPSLFPTLTVLDNLRIAAENARRWPLLPRLLGLPDPALGATEEAARRELDRLGLRAVADVACAALSTGQQRQVELARALCTGARVLLLDEPATGLDRAETERLGGLLRALADEGRALVLVEHDVDLVLDVADTAYVMAAGRVIAVGPPAEVRADPTVRAAYLDPLQAVTGAPPP